MYLQMYLSIILSCSQMCYHIHLQDALLHWCTALQTRLCNIGIRAKRMQSIILACSWRKNQNIPPTHSHVTMHIPPLQFTGIPVPVWGYRQHFLTCLLTNRFPDVQFRLRPVESSYKSYDASVKLRLANWAEFIFITGIPRSLYMYGAFYTISLMPQQKYISFCFMAELPCGRNVLRVLISVILRFFPRSAANVPAEIYSTGEIIYEPHV